MPGGWDKIYTLTPRGHKHPWLIIEDDTGHGEIVAILRVSTEEFWKRLGDVLHIKFVFPEVKDSSNG